MTIISRHHNKNCHRPARHGHAFSHAFAVFHFLPAALLIMLLPMQATAATESNPASLSMEEARWFQVELILFAQKRGGPLDAEQWPTLEGLHLPEALLELHLPPAEAVAGATEEGIPSTIEAPTDFTPLGDGEPPEESASGLPIAYQILGDDALQLTDMAKKLQRSSRYETLLHIAWQQPTEDRQHAKPIFFMEGMTDPLPIEPSDENDDDSSQENDSTSNNNLGESSLSPNLEYATEADTKIGPPNPRFVGTVTLSVERYLHLAADLLYRQPVTQHNPVLIPDLDLWYDRPYPTLSEPQGPAYRLETWQAMRGFQFKESRRMRSTEIHYLDNPFMGLVVVITPVELPEPAEEIQQTSPLNILSAPNKR